ncbi:11-beta-hydroxysteroid dehydrogenase 1B-like protein [Cinnamomum micranthum f. kanehirae]|uniref:11-beta-hydroxysteroid dehydrogenase 1B-like protein n=1 Tax=Cinnamomum micranthum f. kanehirae TaxID=337451 RepID=A0A443P895_9MAGN|nr:11-beta-hydroxysteroid dehydrogenase 1B-like protein [Cinnamomum micranthum f. kanehirae]
MDVVHKFLNIAVPPFTILSLFLCLPSLYCFKLVLFFLRALFIEDMNGKVVLITGASSGIGEQLAYQYAKKGAFLALVARREKSLQEVGERARELGSPDVVVIRADVAKADECKRFVEQAVEHFGKLNHLVNNAGMASVCMFEEATDITKFTPVMASKAALISFYETLRIEFGSDVKRTIATPGVVGLNRGCPKGNFCPKKARCW